MKRLLISVVVLATLMVGCSTEADIPEVEDNQIFYTEEKLVETIALAAQAFEYKDGYIMLIQGDSKDSDDFISVLSNCSKIATALYNEGHDKLAEVFDNLGLAGKFYSIWKDTDKGEHYTTATSYYNEAERLFDKLK